MHIAVPFDVETVRQSWGQPARMWGRVVANHDFLAALVAAPSCSRLTLFVPSRQDAELVGQTLVAGFGAYQSKVVIEPLVRVAASLAAEPADVMHVLDPNLWIAAHIRGQLSRRPFVVTGVTHSLANQHFLDAMLLNNANGVRGDDCLVCTTPTAESMVQSAFARLCAAMPDFRVPATTVIPLGVAAQPPAVARDDARARLGLDSGCFVVVSLARFNPQFKMDLRPLLQLAALVGARAGCAVRFILAGSSGDGSYARFIREQAAAMGLTRLVELVLDPDEAHKARLLAAGDVFLSLSDNIQETFGLTVVEALAAGLPVVASDWDGYRSLVTDRGSGYLVPTKVIAPDASWEAALALRYDPLVHLFSAQTTAVDLDVACERLLALAADPALRARMGGAARDRARLFDWPVVIAQYVALWERLLAARGAPDVAPVRSSALRVSTDFASYASSQLAAGDRFGITAAGEALLGGHSAVSLYHETDEFLDFALMALILRHCTHGSSVAQLSEVLGDGAHPLRLAQNVLWLYKYGYLRVL
jgi:glycosyltransferase involved in cell wall biosynthesis